MELKNDSYTKETTLGGRDDNSDQEWMGFEHSDPAELRKTHGLGVIIGQMGIASVVSGKEREMSHPFWESSSV